MIHILRAIVLSILLTGCVGYTPQQKEFDTAAHSLISKADAALYTAYLDKYPPLDTLKNNELYFACYAYYLERNYALFDDCAERFIARLEPDQPWVPFGLETALGWSSGPEVADRTGTRAEARAMVLTWRSLMRIDVENLKGAEIDIKEAVRVIEEEAENPTVEPSFLVTPFRYPLRFISVEVYRAYGIVQARLNQHDEANRAVSFIRDQTAVLRESDLRKLKNAYAAHVYLAMNDYSGAKKAMDTYSGMSLSQGLLGGLLLAMSAGASGFTALEAAAGGIATFIPGQNPFLGKFLLAKLGYENGDLTASKQAYQLLLKDEQIDQFPNLHFVILHDLAKILAGENDYQQAINYLEQSVEIIEAKRKTINSEGSKIGFVGNKQAIYNDLIVLLVKQGQYAEAFNYVERSKSRAMVDLLASKRKFSGNDVNQAEISEILSQMDSLEKDTTTLATNGTRGIKLLKQQISSTSKEISSLTTVSSIDSEAIQQLLPPQETLVEYYGAGDDLYAFIVDRNDVQVVVLDGAGLDLAISDFRQQIQNPIGDQSVSGAQRNDSGVVIDDRVAEIGQALYKRLINPLEKDIKNKNLTIVPHGSLHYLPFAAMRSNDRFLVEKYSLRILPSASVMEFLQNDSAKHTRTALVFGNPDLNDRSLDLPYAQLEAQKIGKLVPGSTVLIRNQATETAAKKLGAGFNYIHFASHGVFDPENPLDSALLLAKDEENDGRLTVSELYETRMDADLITLSACETALGQINNGDDVVGFTRGFLYAGADSIVSSLWKVDDEATGLLMNRFYLNLAKTSKRKALRDAQLAMISSKHNHPYYWSAFQLTGSIN